MLTPIHIIKDSYTKIFCGPNAFQGFVVVGIVKEYVFVMLMPSQSHGVAFGHIEFHLPIGFPFSLASEVFLQGQTVNVYSCTGHSRPRTGGQKT